jgi:hypothetical protein
MKTRTTNPEKPSLLKRLVYKLNSRMHRTKCEACRTNGKGSDELNALFAGAGPQRAPQELKYRLLADASAFAESGGAINLKSVKVKVRKPQIAFVVAFGILILASTAFAAYKIVHTPCDVPFQGINRTPLQPALEVKGAPHAGTYTAADVTWDALEQALRNVRSVHSVWHQTYNEGSFEHTEKWIAAPYKVRSRWLNYDKSCKPSGGDAMLMEEIFDGSNSIERTSVISSIGDSNDLCPDSAWEPSGNIIMELSTNPNPQYVPEHMACSILPSAKRRAGLETNVERESIWLEGRPVFIMHYRGPYGMNGWWQMVEGTLVIDARNLRTLANTIVYKSEMSSKRAKPAFRLEPAIDTLQAEYDIDIPASYFWTGSRPDQRIAAHNWDDASCRAHMQGLAVLIRKYENTHDGAIPTSNDWAEVLKDYAAKKGQAAADALLHCPNSQAPGISYAIPDNLQGARLVTRENSAGMSYDVVVFSDGQEKRAEKVVMLYEIDPRTGKESAPRHDRVNYYVVADCFLLHGTSLHDPHLQNLSSSIKAD